MIGIDSRGSLHLDSDGYIILVIMLSLCHIEENIIGDIMSTIAAIIKVTNGCNLACKYCYINDDACKGRMSYETLSIIIKQLLSLDKENITFLWHGGEPLLMGIDFYKEVLRIQKDFNRDGKTIKNIVQSNCTLINNDWLDFIEENDFVIGCSLDGPEGINNLTRIHYDGRGAFKDIWKGIELLRQRNKDIESRTPEGNEPKRIGGDGALVVINKLNIDRIDEIYYFFKSHNMNIKFNPLVRAGRGNLNYKDLGIDPDEYGIAMVKLFDKWFYEDEEGVGICPFNEMIGHIINQDDIKICSFSRTCRDRNISFSPKGDVYPCGKWAGIDKFCLGNIHDDLLINILTSYNHRYLINRDISICSECKHMKICNAGCMYDAYVRFGDINHKDFYCPSHYVLYEHISEAILPMLSEAEIKNGEVNNEKL